MFHGALGGLITVCDKAGHNTTYGLTTGHFCRRQSKNVSADEKCMKVDGVMTSEDDGILSIYSASSAPTHNNCSTATDSDSNEYQMDDLEVEFGNSLEMSEAGAEELMQRNSQ